MTLRAANSTTLFDAIQRRLRWTVSGVAGWTRSWLLTIFAATLVIGVTLTVQSIGGDPLGESENSDGTFLLHFDGVPADSYIRAYISVLSSDIVATETGTDIRTYGTEPKGLRRMIIDAYVLAPPEDAAGSIRWAVVSEGSGQLDKVIAADDAGKDDSWACPRSLQSTRVADNGIAKSDEGPDPANFTLEGMARQAEENRRVFQAGEAVPMQVPPIVEGLLENTEVIGDTTSFAGFMCPDPRAPQTSERASDEREPVEEPTLPSFPLGDDLIGDLAESLGEERPKVTVTGSATIIDISPCCTGLRIYGTFMHDQVANSNGEYWSKLPRFVATASSISGEQVLAQVIVNVVDSTTLDHSSSLNLQAVPRRIPYSAALRPDVLNTVEFGLRNGAARKMFEEESRDPDAAKFVWLGDTGEVWPVYHYKLRDEQAQAERDRVVGGVLALIGFGLFSVRRLGRRQEVETSEV